MEDRAAVRQDDDGYVAPRNEVEHVLAHLWAELLAVERVGVNDNFLLLGGESLLAGQAVARIRARFQCDVPVRSIFVGTVADVAAEIVGNSSV